MWLWIKQEIFKTEAPKKPRFNQEVSKSVMVSKTATKTVQIDEEMQSTTFSKSSVKQSLNLRSSEDVASKDREGNYKNQKNSFKNKRFVPSSGIRKQDSSKDSSSSESSDKQSKSSKSSKHKARADYKEENKNYLKVNESIKGNGSGVVYGGKLNTDNESFNKKLNEKRVNSENKIIQPPNMKTSHENNLPKKEVREDLIIRPPPVKGLKNSESSVVNVNKTESKNSSSSSSESEKKNRNNGNLESKIKTVPKFSMASKSIIMAKSTTPKPSKYENEDSILIKRSPVIRYKKIQGNSSVYSSIDKTLEDDSSQTQNFPVISKNQSISSHRSSEYVSNFKEPAVQFSIEEEKSSKSKHSNKNTESKNLKKSSHHSSDSKSSHSSEKSKSKKQSKKDDSSSSSGSKSTSSNKYSQIKTRITLSENSLLELKKTISDLLSAKNTSSTKISQKKYKDGGMYIGELKNDKKEGKGKMIFKGGDIYEGEWLNDKQHGRGKMIWANGATYIGFFDSDEKSGIGEYVWSDGAAYVGEWRDNKFYGYGRYRWADGRIYHGQWENGKRHGFGVLVDKNGHKYEGEFENDKLHGKGVLTKNNGEVTKGVWVQGKLR